MLGHGRRRHLQVGQLGEEQLDRLRVGALVDAVERVAAAAREQPGDGLVRGDHHLLDEHVGERLLLDPRALDAALAVEGELDLPPLDAQRTARKPPVAEGARDLLGETKRLLELVDRALVARQDGLGVAVGQALAAADEAPVEARLAGLEAGAEEDLHGDAAAVLVRPQAAGLVGELVRKHRRNPAGDVGGDASLCGVVVERRARRDVGRDVGNVHPCAHAVPLPLKGQRVVEVLGALGVDRECEEVPQVDPVRLVVRGERRQRRMRGAEALVPEEALEHRLDPARRAENLLDLRAAPSQPDDDEVADRCLPRALAVDGHRDAAVEVRVADEELALAGKLADELFRHHEVAKRRGESDESSGGRSGALRPVASSGRRLRRPTARSRGW